MTENKKTLSPGRWIIGLMMIALPLGIYFSLTNLKPTRNVSSTTDIHDLSDSSGDELLHAFKFQLLGQARLVRLNEGPAIQLGAFLIKNDDGRSVFVCEKYPTIDLVFTAEGMAYSGELPTMIVRGPCNIIEDQQHIEGMPIPFEQILKNQTQIYEISAKLQNSDVEYKIFFRNIIEIWPQEWTWTGVRLYEKDSSRSISITGYEIISVLGSPLVIKADR